MVRRKCERQIPIAYPDELYDLKGDPFEKINLTDQPVDADIARELVQRIDMFFGTYTDPDYDPWKGGIPQSNSDKPWLWKEAWGEDWDASFQRD